MDTIMYRIFTPVGQGAFYFEKHFLPNETFNVIYDCGTLYLSKKKKNKVENCFKNEIINILFISHFDYDHISLIPTLIKIARVKHVFMPFISDEEKKILISFYKVLNETTSGRFHFVIEILENPDSFFNDAETIEVLPHEENKNENPEIIDVDKLSGGKKIRSGTILAKKEQSKNYWIYIPYNLYDPFKSQKLQQLLIGAGIDIEKFKNDAQYLAHIISNKTERRKIRSIYNKLEGNTNANSLLVYSGPLTNIGEFTSFYRHLLHCPFYCYDCLLYCCDHIKTDENIACIYTENPACIYTGDIDLNITPNLKSLFQPYWRKIGTIQVPHHGSTHNFSILNWKDGVYAPISVGKNPFGHPTSSTLQNLFKTRSLPILITETVGLCQIAWLEM